MFKFGTSISDYVLGKAKTLSRRQVPLLPLRSIEAVYFVTHLNPALSMWKGYL